MKFGILGPSKFVQKASAVAQSEFPNITPVPLVYEKYTDAPALVRAAQKKLDGILFTGTTPYLLCKEKVQPLLPWEAVPRRGSSLLCALLTALLHFHCDIRKLSFDSYGTRILTEAYGEIGLVPQTVNIWKAPRNPCAPDYLDELVHFHESLYRQGDVTCCLTAMNSVYQTLNAKKIPVVLIEPTKNIYREALTQLQQKYLIQKLRRSQLTVICIHIDTPAARSLFNETTYNMALAKMQTARQIFIFADQIQAAVTEIGYNEYVLYSTRQALESETNHMRNFMLFAQPEIRTLCTMSIGIGFGCTALEAKVNAENAKLQAIQVGGNKIYIAHGANKMDGPFTIIQARKGRDEITIDPQLWALAQKSKLSIKTLHKLFLITERTGKGEFTTAELGEQLHISDRTVNRIIAKLEAASLCTVVGEIMMAPTGRPRRVVKLDLFKET